MKLSSSLVLLTRPTILAAALSLSAATAVASPIPGQLTPEQKLRQYYYWWYLDFPVEMNLSEEQRLLFWNDPGPNVLRHRDPGVPVIEDRVQVWSETPLPFEVMLGMIGGPLGYEVDVSALPESVRKLEVSINQDSNDLLDVLTYLREVTGTDIYLYPRNEGALIIAWPGESTNER